VGPIAEILQAERHFLVESIRDTQVGATGSIGPLRAKAKLVGGLEHEFYFPFHIWDVILPIDFHSIIFQDG